jgi:hypothetical protein
MILFKTIEKFATESGYTPDAIRTKIKRGVWTENFVWFRAPDKRILISTEGYNEWVLGGHESDQRPKIPLKPFSSNKRKGYPKIPQLTT